MTLRERAFVPSLIFVGAVVAIVSSLGAPLIPRLAQELHTSLGNAQWALTATVVVAGVASPVVGRLGDGRHRKRVIVAGQACVVLGCVLAALANTLPMLIVGRALQGLGLALMPLTMAAAREHLSTEHAGRVIATLSVVGAAGVGLGYPITGLIADHGGVHAAYWAGTAVSALALAAAMWAIPQPGVVSTRQRIDYPGAVLIGLGLVALLISLDKASAWGWGSARTLLLLVAGVLLIALWSGHELRTARPLVELRLLRNRAVLTANVSGLLLGVTMYLSMVTITQFVQLPTFGFGQSVFIAGLTLVPLSVLSASVSRTLPALTARFGVRPIIPLGALAVALSSLFFGLTLTSLWQAFVTMAILGVGLGYTFAAMPGLIVGAVPREETGSAMGFYQVSRFVGFALGSGLAITLLQGFGQHSQPTLHSYRVTALVGAGVGVLTALCAWFLPGPSSAGPDPLDTELAELEREDGALAAAGLPDRSS